MNEEASFFMKRNAVYLLLFLCQRVMAVSSPIGYQYQANVRQLTSRRTSPGSTHRGLEGTESPWFLARKFKVKNIASKNPCHCIKNFVSGFLVNADKPFELNLARVLLTWNCKET